MLVKFNGYHLLLFKRSSTIKIGVERAIQASKLTRTEVNTIVDVAVNCVQITKVHVRPCPQRDKNMMLRFCSIDPRGVVDRFGRRNE